PRIAHMLIRAGRAAAPLAALIEDRDPLRGAGDDLGLRLRALKEPARHEPARGALERINQESRRLARLVPPLPASLSPGAMAALAYPDRIGMRRPGDEPRYLLSGGRGAVLPDGAGLAAEPFLVVTDLDGAGRDLRIRLALPVPEAEIRALFGPQIARADHVEWSPREGRILARRRETLGALILSDHPLERVDETARARAAWDGIRAEGLFWTPKSARLRARIALLPDGPDVSDAGLLADGAWLLPYLSQIRNRADLRGLDLGPPLLALLGWQGQQALNRIAPAHFTTPLGRQVPIDYGAETPSVELRLQEVFGLNRHPVIGGQPLRMLLLSPGQKPVAVTTDLPGFWAGAYAEVRKEMRGRYPRHPWPENPAEADPTLRAKPRGT
ncbi:MAG: ATP-dependent helicase C-terminal domain-containing protein, partial [Paracoccus sp. (in: a-proteobacteria)]|nr:ATP-dependent helicase C-terminal domain-containing protein [Paracoccus sp. (in: a-proteobacteria)]